VDPVQSSEDGSRQQGEQNLRTARFTEDDMVKIPRDADNAPVAPVAKQHGISEQTPYVWRKRYDRLEAADAPARERPIEEAAG